MAERDDNTPVIREHRAGGVVVLSIERRLKGEGEVTLRDRIDGLVREGIREILIDLSDVPYMDSTEIGRLIRCHLSVRQAGGRVRLCNLSPRVTDLMKISRLDTVLDIFASEEAALAVIGKGPEGAAAAG